MKLNRYAQQELVGMIKEMGITSSPLPNGRVSVINDDWKRLFGIIEDPQNKTGSELYLIVLRNQKADPKAEKASNQEGWIFFICAEDSYFRAEEKGKAEAKLWTEQNPLTLITLYSCYHINGRDLEKDQPVFMFAC